MADPIQDVFSALSVMVTPQPAVGDPATQTVSLWQGQGATTTTPYTVTNTLFGALFTSDDLKGVSKSINTGILASVDALNKLANALSTLTAQQGASVQSTLDGLQKALTLAQTLAPGGATVPLSQGSALFGKLTDLLNAVGGDAKKAANELAALAQVLKTLSDLFPH